MSLTHFRRMFHSWPPWGRRGAKGFLAFSVGIGMEIGLRRVDNLVIIFLWAVRPSLGRLVLHGVIAWGAAAMGGIWGGLWFSCGIARCSSISIFDRLSGGIGRVFILGVGVGAGLGGPMGF